MRRQLEPSVAPFGNSPTREQNQGPSGDAAPSYLAADPIADRPRVAQPSLDCTEKYARLAIQNRHRPMLSCCPFLLRADDVRTSIGLGVGLGDIRDETCDLGVEAGSSDRRRVSRLQVSQ
jgi:hypothetical protein